MGLAPVEFWQLTPAELREMAEGLRCRRIREYNDRLYDAYHAAYFARLKILKPEELKKLMINEEDGPKQKRQQTPEEMLTAMKAITLAMGGKVVEV